MKFIICLLLFLPLMASGTALKVDTTITKNAQNEWVLSYKTSAAIERLVLKRSPDNSRIIRWRPVADNFVVSLEHGKEIIRRKDLARFTQVRLYLTPSYTSLAKDYSPFSPFSDGAMLIHTGRFFACANLCTEYDNSWNMTIISEQNDLIIVNGEGYLAQHSWLDKDDGQKVYIGSTAAIENEDFVAVIDRQLPSVLREALEGQLPEMMAFFTKKLDKLKFKPTLFASYSDLDDGSYGNQGGTLPNQVFMHWYGKKAISALNEFQVSWFFAHEIAHLFQRKAANISVIEQQWIHEGGADFMAYQLLNSLGGEYRKYANERLTTDTNSCLKQTIDKSFSSLIINENYQVLYQCGVLFWEMIARDEYVLANKVNIFDIWTAFNSEVESGSPANFSTFKNVLRPNVTEKTFNRILQYLEFRASDHKR